MQGQFALIRLPLQVALPWSPLAERYPSYLYVSMRAYMPWYDETTPYNDYMGATGVVWPNNHQSSMVCSTSQTYRSPN